MAEVAPFPLVIPQDARRVLGVEEFARRVGKACHLGTGTRVLDLGAGGAALVLAREFGCRLVSVDSSSEVLDALRARLVGVAGADRVETRQVEGGNWPFTPGEFSSVVSFEKVLMPFEAALQTFRPFLGSNGHIALLVPLAVGRKPPAPVWEQVFGVPLLPTRDCLQILERQGFEPIAVESLSDTDLAGYFAAVDESLRRFPESNPEVANRLRDQMAAFGEAGDCFTWGCVVGRRKEPGEKPPPSRDMG